MIAGGSLLAFGTYYVVCLETIPYTGRSGLKGLIILCSIPQLNKLDYYALPLNMKGRRHSIMFVSKSHERTMGKIVFDMQREEARKQGRLLPEAHPHSLMVRRVGTKVAQVAAADDPASKAVAQQHMKVLWCREARRPCALLSVTPD